MLKWRIKNTHIFKWIAQDVSDFCFCFFFLFIILCVFCVVFFVVQRLSSAIKWFLTNFSSTKLRTLWFWINLSSSFLILTFFWSLLIVWTVCNKVTYRYRCFDFLLVSYSDPLYSFVFNNKRFLCVFDC